MVALILCPIMSVFVKKAGLPSKDPRRHEKINFVRFSQNRMGVFL